MSKVVIAGMWERGYDAPLTEYDKWFHMQREFLCDEWYMCPISGIQKKGVKELETMDEIIEANADCVPVVVDEKGDVSLPEFKHPEKALYICGIAGRSFIGASSLSLVIPTPRNSGGLWGHQCLPIILYDRMMKSGCCNN